MKRIIGIIIIIIIMLSTILSANAQGGNAYNFGMNNTEGSFFNLDGLNGRPVIMDPYIREADVKYRKRIHRVIDTRVKQNRSLRWDKNPLARLIYNYAMDKTITSYGNDSLMRIKTPEDISVIGVDSNTIQVRDWLYPNDPYAFKDSTVVEEFDVAKIVKFRIMEDWYFDYKHSEYKVKILAIAPLYEIKMGDIAFDMNMFWVNMDDLRPFLIRNELFNSQNDAARLTYDDFFMMRMFDSYIIKRTNVNDIDLNLYKENRDNMMNTLLESENIKNDLFIFEHDLWQY